MSRSVFVIGAGAAGMMAAITAATRGYDVTVFEKNEKPGKKLYITGKGRCNITNACDIEDLFQNIVTNRKFMYSSLYGFDNQAVIDFFEQQGLHTKIERGNRVFPVSDKSSDVIGVLSSAMRKAGVRVRYMTAVEDIIVEQDRVKGVILSGGKKEWADNVIFATGGRSYPVTGSDGKGMEILAGCGHRMTSLYPALVPMNVKEEYIKNMQGLSLKNVRGSFYFRSKQGKKPVYEEFGELLFTHFGISGPIVLSASSFLAKYFSKEEIIFKIDLKPALSFGQLDDRILREFEKNRNRDFKNSLDDLLPKKMIPVMIAYCGIDPDKKVNVISKEERQNLVKALKEFTMTAVSLRGYSEAIITQGGIDVKEINPATMESKRIRHLFLAGELLDVDALTGGFNLQIAWSTGHLAGENVY